MNLIRPFIIALLAWAKSPAQDAAAVSVRTVAFDLPTPTVELSLQRGESGTPQALNVQVNQFGPSTKLPPGTYTAISSSFTDKQSFDLPAGGSGSALLLILTDKKGKWKILPVADDPSRFAPGDRFMINATSASVAIRFDKQRIRLDPGRSSYFRSPPGKAEGDKVEVEMFEGTRGGLKPFNSTYWPVSKDLRTLVLIHSDLRTGKPRVRSLSDIPEPVAPST